MKRFKTILFLMLLLLTVAVIAVACDDTPKKLQFTGLSLNDVTVDYDGQEHTVEITGTLPEGAEVDYTNNKATDSGVFDVTATVTHPDYETLTLRAKLTVNKLNYDMSAVAWNYSAPFSYDGTVKTVSINESALPNGVTVNTYTDNSHADTGTYTAKVTFNYDEVNHNAPVFADCSWKINGADFVGVTFDGLTVDYDGAEHEILVKGLPQGANVAYTANKGTNAGTYNATAVITCKGYNTLPHDAKLVINKINYDMSAVAWDYTQAFTYDGNAKTVLLNGLPAGVTVKTYTDNSKTDAGNYVAKAALDFDSVNYNAPAVDDCSWTINKADIAVELRGDTVEYDTFAHSIQVVGNIPSGVTVKYFYNDVETDEVTEVGDYTVRCEINGGRNYNSKTLTATLKITSTEKALYSVTLDNGTVFFQNDLDGDKLYRVSGSNVVKVNNDTPKYMIANGSKLYYYSTSLFSAVIKSYENNAASALYQSKGEYLTTDGSNIYYAVNNLLINTDQNGIYKLNLNGSDAEPARLTTDKAKYLTYQDNYIYYANVSDNEYLYRVPVGGGQTEKLWEEKVSYVIGDGNNLYFNSTKEIAGTVGYAAAIYKYNVSSGKTVKLTADAGKYLTKVGNYIYYINNDKITSVLFGDGIYRVSALTASDSSLAGTKVLSADNNGYSSLTSDGNNLYYYKLNDKHFYKYDLTASKETDLMANFVPVDDTTLSGYSRVAEYKGEIYYTNPLDSSCLYKFNSTSRAKYKVLADSVSGVYFYSYGGRDYMYYSSYFLVNYALFRMDLSTNEIVKVSSDRLENLIFEGDTMYCTHIKGASGNDIVSMKLDGSDVQIIAEDLDAGPSVVGLDKIGEDFYYILNPAAGFRNVVRYTVGTKYDKKDDNLHKAFNYVIVGDKIYYYADVKDSSLVYPGTKENALKVCDLDGQNAVTLVSNVDITDMYAYGGKIYYTSKSSQNTGLYVYDIASKQTKKISDKSAHGMTVYNGKLYFLNSQVTYTDDYPSQNSACDGKLYCYDGTNVTKVA